MVSVFKDFKIDVVINAIYRYKVNSLTLLPLTFIDLLAYICHTVYVAGGRGLVKSIKAVNRSITVRRRVGGLHKGS